MVWLSLWETRFHSLTYAEMRLIYARSLYKFDMELAPEAQDWISSTTTSPPPKKKKIVWDKPSLPICLGHAAAATA